MNPIYLTPYTINDGKEYPINSKIVIRKSDFKNVKFVEGKMTFSFINCRFRKLEIENYEAIDFEHITIQFISCFFEEIKIENFITVNFSVFFGSSILQGIIRNENLAEVIVNNCLLRDSLFLIDLKKVRVSFIEDNIYPTRWKRLFKSVGINLDWFLETKQSYYIHNCQDIGYSHTLISGNKLGLHKNPYSKQVETKMTYFLSEVEKKKFKISLSVLYSADREHTLTKIINARLLDLSLSGYANGELLIENAKVDHWYIRNLSAQSGATFYDIKPFRGDTEETQLEIHKSNLDNFRFDNIAFNDYAILSLYRNNFGKTTLVACDFPDNYRDFEKFLTVENIHYPEKKDSNYFKTRYETFLQLKKLLENSGNFYESQKFQAITNDALKKIENLNRWDKFILRINSWSNNHGLSIKQPFIATVLVSVVLYVLYLWSLGRMFNSHGVDWNLIGYYFSFLDITHRVDFLVDKSALNGLSVTIDYFNKILVGFLIYQFIAAFRKYGKK
ncbi:hypothetical protein [Flagellimonas sp.]|uniref:hypothetical protein n=1 Tax=Flagellimonas sp. TaxID=2058762 RepID=UPI003BABA849